jgi:hypothetical protein
VNQLRDTGAQVLMLGPVPAPQSLVPVCVSGHFDDALACAPTRSIAVNESGIAAVATATSAASGQYADITDLFCTPRTLASRPGLLRLEAYGPRIFAAAGRQTLARPLRRVHTTMQRLSGHRDAIASAVP